MDQDCFVNRELSWLEFNHRVLDNADYYRIPLCERMNFLSIFQSNLDEFFMVRIGSLIDQKFLDDGMVDTKTGMTPSGQIEASLEKVRTLCAQRDKTYYKLLDELGRQGISLIQTEEIKQKNQVKKRTFLF